MRSFLTAPAYILPFLQPGRLVFVKGLKNINKNQNQINVNPQ